MSRQKKSPSLLIEELLEGIAPTSRQKKVNRAIEAHFQDSRQLDGRGRRSAALENTCRALRHLANMPNWQVDDRYDLNMRRRIRDILKHVDHGQAWSTTIEECSEARGLINKAARKRNERREYGSSEALKLNDELICYPLNSATKLRSAGKRGGNCLGSRRYNHVSELKSGEAEFYEIQTEDGALRAFLRIEKASRKITEIQGPGNDDIDLPVETLWSICRELKTSGDDCADFLRFGVLSLVQGWKSKATTQMSQVLDFQVWWRNGEIVVRDTATRQWSRFIWGTSWRAHDVGWVDTDGSAIDSDAFGLMLRCQPKLSTIAEKARPDGDRGLKNVDGRRQRRMR